VSSISILRVRAFSAQDAKRINETLLEMGERLVNNMNFRSRRDLIEVAETEVRLAEARSKTAGQALSSFRADRSVLDPDRQGAIQLQGVAKLREELLVAETSVVMVGDGGGLLDVSVGVVHLVGHPVVADVEVDEAALSLGTPVPVCRHHDVTEAVELLAFAGGLQTDRELEDLRGA
jgi:hypothetical protein